MLTAFSSVMIDFLNSTSSRIAPMLPIGMTNATVKILSHVPPGPDTKNPQV